MKIKVIGLTGGIGADMESICEVFRHDYNAQVFDVYRYTRHILTNEARDEAVEYFGDKFMSSTRYNDEYIRIMSDIKLRTKLDILTDESLYRRFHKWVEMIQAWDNGARKCQNLREVPYVIFCSDSLIDSGMFTQMHKTINVVTKFSGRLNNLVKAGVKKIGVKELNMARVKDVDRMLMSDFTITIRGIDGEIREQVQQIHDNITNVQ